MKLPPSEKSLKYALLIGLLIIAVHNFKDFPIAASLVRLNLFLSCN